MKDLQLNCFKNNFLNNSIILIYFYLIFTDGDVDAEDMDVSQDGELVQEKDDTAPTKEMTNDSSGKI